ncbi:hypothetical protein [Schaalia sp. lx-260]|uniref:hypothetical protein n=1 Tax=Schaalia sp. lx-260 TaxID=2899082 RepID=UPI001E398629|nr:hypothetical protein [Schaalia sp. lx-260]MCD4549693.1 hypothetical protein [Schaalia sp. lx-260]
MSDWTVLMGKDAFSSDMWMRVRDDLGVLADELDDVFRRVEPVCEKLALQIFAALTYADAAHDAAARLAEGDTCE